MEDDWYGPFGWLTFEHYRGVLLIVGGIVLVVAAQYGVPIHIGLGGGAMPSPAGVASTGEELATWLDIQFTAGVVFALIGVWMCSRMDWTKPQTRHDQHAPDDRNHKI